ncbi:hypothetical protein JD844_006497 [Phrynosoma platyrhinos]|uniref:AB hydrolase-1 domain-containing protein n=1 Tax=Phrynosoma platyrhinos TaxID=52577 RepID=A0ABQ7T1S2_PHRPL|nr:hypothetical protein JD844_006497 [Phrynosoma platyrhinos]
MGDEFRSQMDEGIVVGWQERSAMEKKGIFMENLRSRREFVEKRSVNGGFMENLASRSEFGKRSGMDKDSEAFSAMPELSRKIKMFFALAPVITIKYAKSPTLKLLSSLPDYSSKDILASRDFILSRKPVKDLTTKLCSNTLMQKFCGNLIFFSGGFNATNLNMSRIDVYAARYPDGTSSYPPSYKVEDMVLPTAVWFGGNDLIASQEDTANELITHKGYPSEEYKVVTEDGYILSINRIPFGVKNQGNSVMTLSLVPEDITGATLNFDEMAKYDLPAVLNFILQKTGQQQLYYVGYSQGAAIAFIAFSTMPELAQKIKMFFALAPVTRLKYARSPAIKLLNLPERLLRAMLGKKEFFPQNRLFKNILTSFCGRRLFTSVCGNVFFLLNGYNTKNINMFFPPVYKVEDMTVATAVWSGGKDLLSDPKDVAILLPQLRNLVFHKAVPEWAHLDFIWGLDAPQRMYNKMIELMRQYA